MAANPTLEVQLAADISSFSKGMAQAVAQLNNVSKATQSTSKSTESMARSMKLAAASMAAAFGAQILGQIRQLSAAFIDLVEAPQNLRASFAALTGDAGRAEDMLRRVYEIARQTGVGFNDTADIVKRLTIGLNAMGATNAQIASISKSLLELGRIGGSSVADTTAAALQLSQALASGKLQGDELRAIMERMPLLGQLIAKEMGVGVGELKKMGAEGKITSDIIANSLLKAAKEIDDKFKQMPLTVEQAMNNVRTALQKAFDNPAVVGAIQALANGINAFAGYVDRATANIKRFAADMSSAWSSSGQFRAAVIAMAAALSTALIPAISSTIVMVGNLARALIALTVSNPFTALAAVAVGAAVLIITNWDQVRLFFSTVIPASFEYVKGAFAQAMAALVQLAADAWNKIKQIFVDGVNTVIGLINNMIGAMNSAAAGAASLFGTEVGQIIQPLNTLTASYTNNTAAVNAWSAASTEAYGKADGYMKLYQSEAAKLAAANKDVTASGQEVLGTLNGIASAAGGGGGGGGGKGGKGGGGGAAGGLKKAGDAAKQAAQDFKDAAKEAQELAQQLAQTFTSELQSAIGAIIDGSKSAKEAFADMAKNILKKIADMIIQLLILKPLMGMFGGMFGGGGGLVGGLSGGGGIAAMNYGVFRSPMHARAAGSYQGGGWQVQSAAQVPVVVNNYSSAKVNTYRDNEKIMIELIEDVVSDRISRGGNKIDSSIQRAFGARRQGR